ncbi:Lmo0850 family protein [Bacillus sp. Hm123]
MKNNQRVLKIMDRLALLGVKVSKTKSRIEVYNSLKEAICVKP